MVARSQVRLLAPIALVAVLIAVAIVIASSGGGSSGGQATTATTPRKAVPARRTYRVRQGDSLLAISNRTGVSISRLTALNPNVDPQALRPGQRIKLRP